MSDTNNYKPIRLTAGKSINYQEILRNRPVAKDTLIQKRGPAQELAKLGIKGETKITYRRDKDGNIMYDNQGNPITVTQFTPKEVPDWFTRAISVLSGRAPCYFEGCEEVVQQYHAELEAMEKRPGGCRECERAGLRRKYSLRFRNVLPPTEANKIAAPTIPPYTVTNLATHETVSVPRRPMEFNRIRREVPESIKEVFTKKAAERKLIVNGQEVNINELNTPQQPQLKLSGPAAEPGGTSYSGNS